jgi:hypothetical protein
MGGSSADGQLDHAPLKNRSRTDGRARRRRESGVERRARSVDEVPGARLHLADVTSVLAPLIEAGLVATCAVTEFEVLWSTRSPSDYENVRDDRAAGSEWLTTEDIDWRRTLDVQGRPRATGCTRSVPIPTY